MREPSASTTDWGARLRAMGGPEGILQVGIGHSDVLLAGRVDKHPPPDDRHSPLCHLLTSIA